ncbi:tol-pal system YbgF family protein [Streptomyces sp. NPDC056160]|uniref:tetratricopeptide repeat protein n=1 Tax=Streptomyces sp. NPDC056160 TaxID=3345731 RepID=UPI0035E2869C
MPRRRGRNISLSDLLSEAGMSAGELARNVNRLAAAEGMSLRYDRTAVAHWLAGSRPRGPVPELVAEVLTRRTGRAVSLAETGLAKDANEDTGDDVANGRQADPLRSLVALARIDADPARRSTLLRSVFRELALPDGGTVPTGQDAGRSGRRAGITDADAERVRFMLDQFAANWSRFGGGHARALPASYLGDDIGRLLVRPAKPAARRDLLSATAQLAYLLGEMAADAGHPGLAQRYYYAALRTAAEHGDHRIRAITLRALSVQAVRMGALRYAVDLADTAVTTAGTAASDDLQAFVLAQRAQVRALSGERHEAYRDLGMADRILERAESCPGLFTCYPRAGWAYRKGQVLYRLGDTQAALDSLRYAAQERPSHDRRRRAFSQARVALVLLDLGRVGEACVYTRHFVDECASLRSHRSVLLLKELQGQLVRFRRVPEVVVLLNRMSHHAPTPGTS